MEGVEEQIQSLRETLEKRTTQKEHQPDSSSEIDITEEYQLVGIGRKFYKTTLQSFVAETESKKQAVMKCLDFLDDVLNNQPAGLWFMGKPGTGKTHLSTAICKVILEKRPGSSIKILNITSLLDQIRSTYTGRSQKSESDILRSCAGVSVLVLDDLGKEYSKIDNMGNSWANEKLYKIVNDRYEAEKPIIITTNFNIKDLERKIDPAIISRLMEMTVGVVCNWEDYRRNR